MHDVVMEIQWRGDWSEPEKQFVLALRRIQSECGWNDSEMAEQRLGVSRGMWNDVKHGRRKFGTERQKKIVRHFQDRPELREFFLAS